MFDVWGFFNIILIILFVLFIFTAMIDSIGGPVKVNNMLHQYTSHWWKKSEMHGDESWWSSWKSCRNVHTKCSKRSIWDGNAVSVEFSVYMYSYQLILEFKYLCYLCTGTWKYLTETLPRRSRRKLYRVWVLSMKTWVCVLFLMLHRQSGKFK